MRRDPGRAVPVRPAQPGQARRWSSSTCSATSSSPAASAQRSATTSRRLQAIVPDGAPPARRLPRRRPADHPHPRVPPPDLSDCPPAKRARGSADLAHRRRGPDGPHPDRRRAGQRHRRRACARCRARSSSTSRARAPSTPPTSARACERLRHHPPGLRRRHHRGLRADHDARGQRPRLRVPAGRGRTESYFPEFKAAAIEMIRAQGGIVGWTTPADQLIGAITAR